MNPTTNDSVLPPHAPATIPLLPADPNGAVSKNPEEEVESEEIQYNPIPPRRVITVSVQYELQGGGQPLPYEIDEGASEE